MGYIENAQDRLENPDNILVEHKPLHPGGRKPGEENIPEFIRAIIGSTAKVTGSPKAARAFGVSQPTALTASKGKRSPNGPVIPDLKAKISENIAKVREKAVDGLMKAMDIIPDKIDDTVKLRDLADAAKSLSSVVDRLAPSDERAAGVNVVFYTPKVREVLDYEILDVESKVIEE